MSESEEYYRRQNMIADAACDAAIDDRIKELERQKRKYIERLCEDWAEANGEKPPETVVNHWGVRGVYAVYYTMISLFDKKILNKSPFSKIPTKGTQERKDWDASKKRGAARCRAVSRGKKATSAALVEHNATPKGTER